MLTFQHGIRWAFLRPVWAPFRRCLPLLVLLRGCPEDDDEDEEQRAENCGLLGDYGEGNPPSQGNQKADNFDPHAKGEGFLQPSHGEFDEDDGEFLLPNNAEGVSLLPINADKMAILLPQNPAAEGVLRLQSSILYVFDPGGLLLRMVQEHADTTMHTRYFLPIQTGCAAGYGVLHSGVKMVILLPHRREDAVEEALKIDKFQPPVHAVFDIVPAYSWLLPTPMMVGESHAWVQHDLLLYLLMMGDFDPGEQYIRQPKSLSIQACDGQVCSSANNVHVESMQRGAYGTAINDHAHLNISSFSSLVYIWHYPHLCPRGNQMLMTVVGDIRNAEFAAGSNDEKAWSFVPPDVPDLDFLSYHAADRSELITVTMLLALSWADCVAVIQSVQHVYNSNHVKLVDYLVRWLMGIFINALGRSCKDVESTFFLIPLRGRRCYQCADEDASKEEAAMKTNTTQRRTALRFSYLTKDVLDPG